MYSYEIRESLEKKFHKLSKKDVTLLKIVEKKIPEILRNPHHYKNLRSPLQNLKRVHIGKSYVLLFSVDEKKKIVIFEGFDHHNKVYNM